MKLVMLSFSYLVPIIQVESVRELINSIDVSHIAMLRLVAELLSMVRHIVHFNVILKWQFLICVSTGCVILWGKQDELRDFGYLLCSIYVPLPSHQLCSHSDEVPYWSLCRNFSTMISPRHWTDPLIYWCTDTIMHFVFYNCTPMFCVLKQGQ